MSNKLKKYLFLTIKFTVSIGIITYILIKQVDVKQIYSCLSNSNGFYLLFAAVIFLFTLSLGLFRWSYLLRAQNIIVKFIRLFRIYCVGLFFNLFLVGLTGGDVIKIYYIAKETDKKIEGGTTVLIDRIAGLSALLTLVFVSIIITYHNKKFAPLFWPVIISFFCMIIGMFVIFNIRKLQNIFIFKTLLRYIPLRNKLSKMLHSVHLYRNHKSIILKVFLISFLVHPLCCLVNFIIAKAIGIEGVPLIYYFVLIPIISFISALPISVSGWGVGEALYVSFFGMFGVTPTLAVTLSITYKLYYIACGLLCSLAYMLPGLSRPSKEIEGIVV